jgi:predicted PurR-regulated permease PerM
MDKDIVISIKTILVTFLIALGVYVIYRLGPIIGLFAFALLIVFALEPFIKKLMQQTVMERKIPRSVAVIISYTALIAIVALIITIWLPPFLLEAQKLIKNLPKILSGLDMGTSLDLSALLPQASTVSGGVVVATLSIFSNITTLFSLFVMSIYLSMDWPNLKRRFVALFPAKAEDSVLESIDEIEINLGHWLKGEAILMLVVGFACFIGLVLLDVDYPLALGLISGLLEIVPMVGPIISAVFAAIIALASNPVKAVGVVVLYIIVQQLENNVLVPKVMQKVSGFSPLVILIALLVGGEFFGIAGAIMAVPATMTLGIIIKKIFRYMR